MKARLYLGDCLDLLRSLPDDSIDSVVTDPPYGLGKPPKTVDVLEAWLAGEKAQQMYADANYEYPVRAGVAIHPTIAGYGKLNADTLPISKIAANRKTASTLVDKVGFDN